MEQPDNSTFTEWVTDNIKELQKASFFGKLIIEFRNGKVVLLRQEQTIKPPEEE